MINTRWVVLAALVTGCTEVSAQTCHYQDWRWNVAAKRAVQQTSVTKDDAMLSPDERDAQTGCSVCREDQQSIRLAGLPEFAVCHKYAEPVQAAIEKLLGMGAKINSVIGYRVGRTRGGIDAQGNRTGFSNHSFGIAVDINTEHNGLYDNCIFFGPQCQLLRGGLWRPGVDPYSLQQDGLIVRMFKEIGFKWGGEIKGKQKDFMHFSPTGY